MLAPSAGGDPGQISIPVHLADPDISQRCAGTLSAPSAERDLLVVLVHGGTYNRWFWAPTYRPERYSFVAAATRRGLATLNMEFHGAGSCAAPNSPSLTLDFQALVLSAIVQRMRADSGWSRVVLIGHSLGSATIIRLLEMSAVPIDAAVLTGFTRRRSPDAGGLAGLAIDAMEDPRFAYLRLSGYSTLPAGSRPYFYHLATTDPAMILEDERHRDIVSLAALAGLDRDWEGSATPTESPVFIVVGAEDFTYRWDDPDDFAASQRSYYPCSPTVDSLVVPETGHSLFLHGRGPEAMESVLDWVVRIAG